MGRLVTGYVSAYDLKPWRRLRPAKAIPILTLRLSTFYGMKSERNALAILLVPFTVAEVEEGSVVAPVEQLCRSVGCKLSRCVCVRLCALDVE